MNNIAIRMSPLIILLFTGFLFNTSCNSGNSEAFFYAATGLNQGRILVSNSVTNPVSHSVSMYSLSGEFLGVLLDTSVAGRLIRGMSPLDLLNIIVSTDTPDELISLNLLTGETQPFAASNLFAGNIYHNVRQSSGVYLAIESNTIEKFVGGLRSPPVGTTPYISATTGSCTLSAPRSLRLNSLGELIVTSFSNAQILRYDISGSTPNCLIAIDAIGTQPIPLTVHPSGLIFYGTQNDAIYSVPEDLGATPTAVIAENANINNPTAMATLPNGNIIIANDGTDTIIEIDALGNIINSAFIKNALTGTVTDILVIE